MLDAAAVIHRYVHERQRVIEFLPERPGSISGRQPGSMSLEQRDSDLGLQGPHSQAYGGRCDAQFSGGPRKIAVPDTGSQDTQGFQRRQRFTHPLI
jgi:hypothetical protein